VVFALGAFFGFCARALVLAQTARAKSNNNQQQHRTTAPPHQHQQ
jgi:hypothetical protein